MMASARDFARTPKPQYYRYLAFFGADGHKAFETAVEQSSGSQADME